MSFPSHLFPDLVSRILAGDRWSPGKVTISGADRQENWDVQEAQGSAGASTVRRARKPGGPIQFEFYLTDEIDSETGTSEQDDWESFQAHLESTVSGPEPFALPVYHPDLAEQGYLDLVLDFMGPAVRDEKGGVLRIVKMREYAPPKKSPAKAPTGAAEGAGGADATKPPNPNAAAYAELDALIAQAGEP